MGGRVLSRLVVVSNRIPFGQGRRAGAEGGLAVALSSALREKGGMWFGWSGRLSPHESTSAEVRCNGAIDFATIDLTERDYEEYYFGFANRTLWPLFHYRPGLTEFHRRYVAGYNRVNALFANRLVPLLRPDDSIWVHDYHLIPLANHLRQAGCRQRIGFFLHIPWPALAVYLALPDHREIVRQLCQYDLVGFQTREHLDAFRDYIVQEAGGIIESGGTIRAFERRFRAAVYPISIDTEDIAEFSRKAETSRHTKRLSDSLGGRALIIGVDRLDYSKGIVQRVEAYQHLLESYPENRGHVVLLQITPSSRSDIPEYAEIKQQLESAMGHINGTYAEFDWVPVRYVNRGYNRHTLAGFFRISRIGLVTPLRDGMNLVAKEYVAAQSPEDPGVLVLSRFAGAAHELDGAVMVNPYDVEGVGEALQKALGMPLAERQERWRKMFEHLRRHDVAEWRENFLSDLASVPIAR